MSVSVQNERVYNSNNVPLWNYPLINEDSVLKMLNEKAAEIYYEYDEFDSLGQACWFKYENH